MEPGVIFCYGPFHGADYCVAKTLLNESSVIISFADAPQSRPPHLLMQDPLATSSSAPSAREYYPSIGKHRGEDQTALEPLWGKKVKNMQEST